MQLALCYLPSFLIHQKTKTLHFLYTTYLFKIPSFLLKYFPYYETFFSYHETIKKVALKIRKGDRLLFVIKKTGETPVYVKVGAQCIVPSCYFCHCEGVKRLKQSQSFLSFLQKQESRSLSLQIY